MEELRCKLQLITQGLLIAIKENNEDSANLYFDHGIDVNLQFTAKSLEEKTPMHIAAEFGAISVLLALVSRGAGVDPLDS